METNPTLSSEGTDSVFQPVQLIGVAGNGKRAGKDSFADVLVRHYGFKYYSLSAPILAHLCILNPLVTADLRFAEVFEEYGYEEAKDKFPEFRTLMVRYGTDLGRKIFSDYIWVDECVAWVQQFKPEKLVIPNIRFANEIEMIKFLGGQIVYIHRPGNVPAIDGVTGKPHESDLSVKPSDCDVVIHNSGTLDDLVAKAHDFCWQL